MRLSVTAALLLCAAAYYVYLPLPPGVCEPWKLMLLDALFRSFMTAGDLFHSLGLLHRVHLLNWLVSLVEDVPARSCSALNVTDVALGGVPTRVYRPWGAERLRRAVLYFHGGGWALGSARMRSYDLLCRKMAEDLDAVIMSVDYGLAPDSVFPAQYFEALSASRSFLSAETWRAYALDPDRLCISGDSAGANLAAAVTQTVSPVLLQSLDLKLRLCSSVMSYIYLLSLSEDRVLVPSWPKTKRFRVWPRAEEA